jgi:hypothetical protein
LIGLLEDREEIVIAAGNNVLLEGQYLSIVVGVGLTMAA